MILIPSTGAQVLLADATCCIAAKSCGELGEDVESVVHFRWVGYIGDDKLPSYKRRSILKKTKNPPYY